MKRLLIPAALALSGCIDVPAQPAKDALDVQEISAPSGVGLETACTPTGPEICFDARDNNCNGVIDEGCGLHTGLLQFVIAWDTEADVDLNVYDPNQELVHAGETTAAGLQKDRDCGRTPGECQGQNQENVYLAEGEPRKGKYKVVVHLENLRGTAPPVRVRLGVRMGSRSYGMSVELSPGTGTDEKEFSFELR